MELKITIYRSPSMNKLMNDIQNWSPETEEEHFMDGHITMLLREDKTINSWLECPYYEAPCESDEDRQKLPKFGKERTKENLIKFVKQLNYISRCFMDEIADGQYNHKEGEVENDK